LRRIRFVLDLAEAIRRRMASSSGLKPAVVILDISMPLLNGIDTAREIRKVDPKIKIVFLTMHSELAHVQEAFGAGTSGYVIKHSASFGLLSAIRRALLGARREPTAYWTCPAFYGMAAGP
jgi:DNA-binding NarL/FixJ family response regulator